MDIYGLEAVQYCGIGDLIDCFKLGEEKERLEEECAREVGPPPKDLADRARYTHGTMDMNLPIRECVLRKHPGLYVEFALACGKGVDLRRW